MFKFVAVFAFLAVAAASPGAIISTPLAYSTGIAPAVTTYSTASGIYSSNPLVYSSQLAYPTQYGYAHLIKKRSPGLVSNYIASAPLATTYSAGFSAPLATTYAAAPLATYSAPLATAYGAPIVSAAPIYTTAHLIKKRSAPLIVPSSYIAPATYSAAAPIVSTYSSLPAAPYYSSIYSSAPLAYTQFIKK